MSSLVHVTLPPTFTAIGLGEYAVDDLLAAFTTIDTAEPVGVGVGAGVGVGVGVGAGELDDPHPAANANTETASTHTKLLRICGSSLCQSREASSLPAVVPSNPA